MSDKGGTDLVIVGRGGLTREVLELIESTNAIAPRWNVIGIVDDAVEHHGSMVHGHQVLGGVDLIRELSPSVQVLLCTGSPRNFGSRQSLVDRLSLPPERYATLVHPQAVLARTTRVDPGTIILAGVIVTADVEIGAHVVVMPATVLTHDDVIADYVTIAAGVRLAGGVQVRHGAYLGASSIVREGVEIGERALIGMGSVVLTDVPAGEVWVGSPAKRLRSETHEPPR